MVGELATPDDELRDEVIEAEVERDKARRELGDLRLQEAALLEDVFDQLVDDSLAGPLNTWQAQLLFDLRQELADE